MQAAPSRGGFFPAPNPMGALNAAHRQHPMGASRQSVKLQCKKEDTDCDFIIEQFEKSD